MNRECLAAFYHYRSLFLASGHDDEWTLWLCKDHGDGMTPLMKAAFSGDMACIAILLPISDANAQNHRGQTALMLCLERGLAEVARKLIPISRLELTDHQGLGPFDYALRCRSPICQRMIGQALADQIATEISKYTAFGASNLPHEPRRV